MGKRHGPERGIADRGEIKLQDRVAAQRMRVMDAQPHDEIVRMLRIHQGLAIRGLAGLKQFRVAAIGDRGRFQAQHQIELKAAAPERVGSVEHAPVGRKEFVGAARAGFLRVHDEGLAHPHQVPTQTALHEHRHRARFRIFAGPRSQTHQVSAGRVGIAHLHVRVFLLRQGKG